MKIILVLKLFNNRIDYGLFLLFACFKASALRVKVLNRVGALLFFIRTLQRPLERLSIVAIKYLSGPKLVQTSYSMFRKYLFEWR